MVVEVVDVDVVVLVVVVVTTLIEEEVEAAPVGLSLSAIELVAEGDHVDRAGGEQVFRSAMLSAKLSVKNATSE